MNTCSNCRVYDSKNDGTGYCRMNPPQYQSGQWLWPVCKDSDWCNRWLNRNAIPGAGQS